MKAIPLLRERFATPVGEFLLITDEAGALRAANWSDREYRMAPALKGATLDDRSSPSPGRLALEAYFAGDLTAIDSLAVDTGGTPFQQEVWTRLRTIPVGATFTYRRLAQSIGRPSAIRAAGLANATNPVSVVVPCHRVIGSDGSLTGYGGGLERKAWLLNHEGVGV
ncbi:methylated-DNA-[protein]-cysteine S-methyltransferase [Caulobacter ginsengisoli]|uniref:Methylated-DNA--protein-cysteine methyltransferase n=1 Tax=Caulobacter ginsengisoli TaxID=400775 RepID=A0ABU0IXM6_9CAUL|nr:methylated-DNA--[protein]-cysteine S-methyltransferase [Caulobacter ginsengisoli]MDQ0466766.1 methylated-DNA-[protein]-cysteine S-methyltransferase [Caulobacter ginsengisoli]